jgi:hypothetical protein
LACSQRRNSRYPADRGLGPLRTHVTQPIETLSATMRSRCGEKLSSFGAEMETRVRRVVFVLLALTTTAHAQSVVFSYDQWERLSTGLKEIYISGAIDAVSTITTPAQAGTAMYYNDCLVRKEIKVHDIVEEMKVVVQSRPELYPKPATGALLAALIKLCGLPNPELK